MNILVHIFGANLYISVNSVKKQTFCKKSSETMYLQK